MANTNELKEKVEKWYREQLQERYPGYSVVKENVKLKWGGKFECDAVIKTESTIFEVRCLSCSEYKTRSNNGGSGKLLKIKGDALMLSAIECQRKTLSFTGYSMYEKILSEQKNGRFPNDIILEYWNISNEEMIKNVIEKIYSDSSNEMNPEI